MREVKAYSLHAHLESHTIYYILIHVNSSFVKEALEKAHSFSYNRRDMKKDAPLAFRIPTDLKRKLQETAKSEARSISQVCEIFLRLGVEGYEKEGSRFLQRFLSRQKKEGPSE